MTKRRWLSSLLAAAFLVAVFVAIVSAIRPGWIGSWFTESLAASKLPDTSGTGKDRTATSGDNKLAGNVKTAGERLPRKPGPIYFTQPDSVAIGIRFHQVSGNSAEKMYPAANGTGVAMFDLDGDGRMDLYFVTSTHFPLDATRTEPHNELYRNRGDGMFEDVTMQSRTGHAGFGQGVTAADFDNDGFQDLYLPCYGGNVMFRNNGDGTFSDVTEQSGTGDRRWGTSCAALDYDGDGNLDFYVANYGQWSPETNQFCGDTGRKVRTFCNPKYVEPERHALYRNEGDGTFRDVLPSLGIDRRDGRGQGVVAADLNDDGLIDLYVANDICPNFVFFNRGGGRFEDVSELCGATRSLDGQERAGMGVDAEDVTGDGRPDLFVTNFYGEPNSMFRNDGNGFFTEITAVAGFQSSGIPMVKWGTRLADLDNDGWPDIFVTSGHVDDNLVQMGNPNAPHEEPALLWRNKGKGRFEPVGDSAGPYFAVPHVGRGAAFGDLDNDGDIDIVVNHVDGIPAILLNESPRVAAERGEPPNHWIRLVLRGRSSNRDAIGSRVIVRADGREIHRQIKGGMSYGSAHDPRLLIGIGRAERVDQLEIRWPGGRVSRLENLDVDREFRLIEPDALMRE